MRKIELVEVEYSPVCEAKYIVKIDPVGFDILKTLCDKGYIVLKRDENEDEEW